MYSIGETIKRVREAKKLSQRYLCDGIMTRTALSKIENGHSLPRIDIFNQLLQRLNISYEEFFYLQNDMQLTPYQKLLTDFQKIRSNADTQAIDRLIQECQEYKEQEGNNYMVDRFLEISRLQQLFYEERKKEAKALALELWEKIKEVEEWTLFDFKMVNSILFLFDKEQVILIGDMALKWIKKYQNFNPLEVKQIEIVLQLNLGGLLNSKKIFEETLETCLEINRYDLATICRARIAMIEQNRKQFEEELNFLEKNRLYELKKGLEREWREMEENMKKG